MKWLEKFNGKTPFIFLGVFEIVMILGALYWGVHFFFKITHSQANHIWGFAVTVSACCMIGVIILGLVKWEPEPKPLPVAEHVPVGDII